MLLQARGSRSCLRVSTPCMPQLGCVSVYPLLSCAIDQTSVLLTTGLHARPFYILLCICDGGWSRTLPSVSRLVFIVLAWSARSRALARRQFPTSGRPVHAYGITCSSVGGGAAFRAHAGRRTRGSVFRDSARLVEAGLRTLRSLPYPLEANRRAFRGQALSRPTRLGGEELRHDRLRAEAACASNSQSAFIRIRSRLELACACANRELTPCSCP